MGAGPDTLSFHPVLRMGEDNPSALSLSSEEDVDKERSSICDSMLISWNMRDSGGLCQRARERGKERRALEGKPTRQSDSGH